MNLQQIGSCRIDLNEMLVRAPPMEQQEKLMQLFEDLGFRNHGPRLQHIWNLLP